MGVPDGSPPPLWPGPFCYNQAEMIERLPNEELLLDPKPGTAAAREREFGIDLTLTVENLRRTPQERILRLDRMRKRMKELRRESRLDRETRHLRQLLELKAIYEYQQSLRPEKDI